MSLVKAEPPIDIIRSMKEGNIFTAEKKSFPILHLKGIGKFCKVCDKKLQPKTVLENRRGKIIRKLVPIRKDQKYCSSRCSHKDMRRNGKPKKNNSISCRINLNMINDFEPHFKMVFYFGNSKTLEFKITKRSKELYEYLQRATRYRFTNAMSKEEVILAR